MCFKHGAFYASCCIYFYFFAVCWTLCSLTPSNTHSRCCERTVFYVPIFVCVTCWMSTIYLLGFSFCWVTNTVQTHHICNTVIVSIVCPHPTFFSYICLCLFRAQSYAERLRLGLAVLHGEAHHSESDMTDGRHSPPLSRTTSGHTGLELPCKCKQRRVFYFFIFSQDTFRGCVRW